MWHMLEAGLSQSPSGMGPQSFSHMVTGGSREELRKAERPLSTSPERELAGLLMPL